MIPRRSFLSLAGAGVLGATAVSYGRILGAHERIRVGVIGLRSRGNDHLQTFGDQVVAICDCDRQWLQQRAAELRANTGRQVATFTDYRALVDQPDIDAVSIATPNHTHALIAITAVLAGKHVYVEKPVSHNVWEGRQLVRASRRYGRIVQCGTQSRSSPSLAQAVEFVRSGRLGPVEYAVGTCYKPRKSIGKLDRPLEIPATVDYDLWCGPAPLAPLFRPNLHYDWHWDFSTGNGDMGNQGIHQMDIARWFLGESGLSPLVISVGGRCGYDDAGNTPNSQTVLHAYPTAPLIFETRGLPRSAEYQNGAWDRNMDEFRGSRVGVIIQCRDGHVLVPNYTSARAIGNDGQTIESWDGGGDHYANFLAAVRANNPALLNADIEEGHISSALCHTGNVSHQGGRPASLDEIRSCAARWPVWADSVERLLAHLAANGCELDRAPLTLGQPLEVDPAREQVTSNAEANRRLTRDYRAGYELPNFS